MRKRDMLEMRAELESLYVEEAMWAEQSEREGDMDGYHFHKERAEAYEEMMKEWF